MIEGLLGLMKGKSATAAVAEQAEIVRRKIPPAHDRLMDTVRSDQTPLLCFHVTSFMFEFL
jgi:hypothetical protein